MVTPTFDGLRQYGFAEIGTEVRSPGRRLGLWGSLKGYNLINQALYEAMYGVSDFVQPQILKISVNCFFI